MSPTVSQIHSAACLQLERLCKPWMKKEIDSITEHCVVLENYFNNAEEKKKQGKIRMILTEAVSGQLSHTIWWLYVT